MMISKMINCVNKVICKTTGCGILKEICTVINYTMPRCVFNVIGCFSLIYRRQPLEPRTPIYTIRIMTED